METEVFNKNKEKRDKFSDTETTGNAAQLRKSRSTRISGTVEEGANLESKGKPARKEKFAQQNQKKTRISPLN